MTTWSGWDADFLAAASLPNTAGNRRFLDSWAANANSPNCGNNPIDLTHKEPGSSNCGGTNLAGDHVQRYTSHTWARTAFNTQIHSASYADLLAALRSGNPYAIKSPGPVSTDLGTWGSTNFANVYLADAQSGPPGTIKAPHALSGWKALRKSVNQGMPRALNQSQKARHAALRSLSRAHKVRP